MQGIEPPLIAGLQLDQFRRGIAPSRGRLRRSAGRRYRTFTPAGVASAWATRQRACRSAAIIGRLTTGLGQRAILPSLVETGRYLTK